MTDDFTPRLGRIGDRGRAGRGLFSKQLKKAVAKLRKPSGKSRFTGRQSGRGGASARRSEFKARKVPAYRMRRVIVKVHIARAQKGGGTGGLKAHVGYLRRDGVERGGSGGVPYARDGVEASLGEFVERCEGDRHHFRIIVSAEDGAMLGDLKAYTRALMQQMETDLGTRLDWTAVDHHNTGHPHTHIVIRGREARGRDLVIAPDYIRRGLARRAEEIVTEQLGPRRDLEIARSRQSEIVKDRFTGIDRKLAADVSDGLVSLKPGRGPAGRFELNLRRARLRHLQTLQLAEPAGRDVWQMKEGWEETLKAMGRRGDVIRTLAARFSERDAGESLRLCEPDGGGQQRVIGTVLASVPDDELRDTRALVIEDFDKRRWMVRIGASEPGTMPPEGAVVELRPREVRARSVDRTIASIAAGEGGQYSATLHEEADPGSSPAYRQTHVRRLEALRRSGLVERGPQSVWQVPADFLERAARYDARRLGPVGIEVKSWLSVEAQVRHVGLTWLDQESEGAAGTRLDEARRARISFLQQSGLLAPDQSAPDDTLRERLRQTELDRAGVSVSSASGRSEVRLDMGMKFDGQFERAIDLGQGRFALIGNAKEFALVPWRPEIEQQRGRELTVTRTARGVSWTVGIERGLGR